MISASAPAFSVSTERSESLAKIGEHQIQYGEGNSQFKKPNHGKGSKYALLSPRSASSVRRSPRFKVFPSGFIGFCFLLIFVCCLCTWLTPVYHSTVVFYSLFCKTKLL